MCSCVEGNPCAPCLRAHLDRVYAGIEMREIKKQLRVEYRPAVAVSLRAKLKQATLVAQGKAVVIEVDPNILSDLEHLSDIGR